MYLFLCGSFIAGARAEITQGPEFLNWVDMRDQGVVKQSLDYSCGPAAMATLLSYYFQVPTSEQDVLDWLERHSTQWQLPDDWRQTGVSMAALAKIGNYSGLDAVGVAVNPQMLRKLKVPVIVYLEHRGFPHFSVIRGVDSLGRVQLADPSWGNQLLSQREFAKLWPRGPKGKGKLLLLRPRANSSIVTDPEYITAYVRGPKLSQRD